MICGCSGKFIFCFVYLLAGMVGQFKSQSGLGLLGFRTRHFLLLFVFLEGGGVLGYFSVHLFFVCVMMSVNKL